MKLKYLLQKQVKSNSLEHMVILLKIEGIMHQLLLESFSLFLVELILIIDCSKIY